MEKETHPDAEDHCELFGDMFESNVELVQETHTYGGREFFVKATHIYYGKTSKFMPLTVWPSCPGFLEAFVGLSGLSATSSPTHSLTDAAVQTIKGCFEAGKHKLRVLELGAGTGLFSIVCAGLLDRN